MFVLFGFLLSVFGSCLAYVSYLEDRLLAQYFDQGCSVIGDVVSSEFTRGVSNNEEYFVSVEYAFILSSNYPVRIRKQVRVLEGQFFNPDLPGVHRRQTIAGSKPNVIFQDPCSTYNSDISEKVLEISLHDEIVQSKHRIEIIASGESLLKNYRFSHGRKQLELLVLSNHHLSGLPARQVEQRLSTKYRIFSACFVIAAVTLAIFCFHIAAEFLLGTEYMEEVSTPTTSTSAYLLCAILSLIPIIFIHLLFHESIRRLLEEQYFGDGEIIEGGHQEDDSSLSTWNTNSVIGFKMSAGSLPSLV
jgi:hypothetical protein